MGFLEILTLVLIVLKLIGTIHASWLVVFSPLLVSAALYAIIVAVMVAGRLRS